MILPFYEAEEKEKGNLKVPATFGFLVWRDL